MSGFAAGMADMGLEVVDLQSDLEFGRRHIHTRDVAVQMEGMRRLARAFVDSPSTILQELANAAVDLCGADSAGISMEQAGASDEHFYKWIATAGEYGRFLDAMLPRYPSACAVCLERGRPQVFRVSQRFFDLMGLEAPTVTDGILMPWQVEEMRGTIWIMAHTRTNAFDRDDYRMMQTLSDFAAMAVRHERQETNLILRATSTASAAMANELAHQINNPLQSLTNIVYLASEGGGERNPRLLAEELSEHILRLSQLVGKLLLLPT